jgi:hypothetical protein
MNKLGSQTFSNHENGITVQKKGVGNSMVSLLPESVPDAFTVGLSAGAEEEDIGARRSKSTKAL